MEKYVLKLKPLAITKTVVVIMIMVVGFLLALKSSGVTAESEKYIQLGGGAILIGIGAGFCMSKYQVLYFFGIIWLFAGSFGLTTYALIGQQQYFVVYLSTSIVMINVIAAQLTLVIAVMVLAIFRIAKHFLCDDKVLIENFY